MSSLNIGCGSEMTGDIRLDKVLTKGVNIIGDAENLPFRPDTFNEIYERNLLEHLSNPKKHLDEVQFVMKKDGRLTLITDHNKCLRYYFTGSHSRWHKHAESNAACLKYFVQGFFKREHGRHSLFSEKDIRNLMEEAHLKVKKLELVDTTFFTRYFDRLLRLIGLNQYPRIRVEAEKP